MQILPVPKPDASTIFLPSENYLGFLDNFTCTDKLEVNYKKTEVSEAIYFHLCKMKYAGWRHRINFKRHRKHSIADIFQDMIAFYLKATLPANFTVELECKVEDTQPDIVIKDNLKNWFIIEIKTNIGWDRSSLERRIESRIELLAKNFKVDKTRIIYIFEEHSNVSKDFSKIYWNYDTNTPVERPIKLPYSAIYPLFNTTDPYYWKWDPPFKKNEEFPKITDGCIKEMARKNVVTPFEKILELITKVP
jgi:hypothetical protein